MRFDSPWNFRRIGFKIDQRLELARKEFMDIVTERVYILAFFVQMIMVIGIIYTAILYTSIAAPETGGELILSAQPRVGVINNEFDLKFKGLKVVDIKETGGTADLKDMVEADDLVAIIVFPENIKEKIENGQDVKSILYLDNTNVLSGYADSEISKRIEELSDRLMRERMPPEYDPDVLTEPIGVQVIYLGAVRGTADAPEFVELMYGILIPFILLLPTFLSTNMMTDSIVGEKERKTYEILIASPLTKREIIIGKTLPILVIALLQAFLWIVLLNFRGIAVYNVSLLILLLILLNLAFIGFGIIISAFSDNIKDANTGVTLILIVASILFFLPLSLRKEIYAMSPASLISRLSSNPSVDLAEILPGYLILVMLGLIAIYLGGRLLDVRENLRL